VIIKNTETNVHKTNRKKKWETGQNAPKKKVTFATPQPTSFRKTENE
jgi:hypothetical protein